MQTRIPIFDDYSFSDLLDLRGLSDVNIRENRRLKKSWRLEKKGRLYTLLLPEKLLNSPHEIKQALLDWTQVMVSVNLQKSKLTQQFRRENQERENRIFEYLIEQGEVTRFKTYKQPHIRFRHASGVQFDLYELFKTLNREWFDDELKSYLRWGQYGSRTSYHSLFHDETGTTNHLITIGGLYNHPSVPQYAVESVLYHEMLHIALPPIESQHRRNVHHKAFREAEQRFVHFDQWQKWIKKKAHKLYNRGF